MKVYICHGSAYNVYTNEIEEHLGIVAADASCVAKGMTLEMLEQELPLVDGWEDYRVLVGVAPDSFFEGAGFVRKEKSEPCSDPKEEEE